MSLLKLLVYELVNNINKITYKMKVAGRVDPIPNIRAAGKIIAMGGEGAHNSIPHTGAGPGTPEHIRRYRKSF
jgi:hypothetical protein